MLDDENNIIMDDSIMESGAKLTHETQKEIRTIGIWGMFLTVIGIISIMMFALSGFSVYFASKTMGVGVPSMVGLSVFMFALGVFTIVPVIYLLRFSLKAIRMRNVTDSEELMSWVVLLKNFFMFLSIMIIVMTVFFIGWSMYMATQNPSF